MAPMPGTVRSGGGCGELPLGELAVEELRLAEAAQATDEGGEERKGAVVEVWREPEIDENDLRSALAAAPREVGLLLLPYIAERAADVVHCGLCGVEAEAEAEAIGADDEILIDAADDEKEAIIDGKTGDDDEGKGERRRREEELLLLAESAATSETRRLSLLDRRKRIRSASLVRRRENGGRG